MMHSYFEKTAKGREEIATRRHGLSLRLRSILLLIDGKRSVDDLLHAYPGLGLTEALLADLQTQGYIADIEQTARQNQSSEPQSPRTTPEPPTHAQSHLSISIDDGEPGPSLEDPLAAFMNTIFPDELVSAECELHEDGLMTATEEPAIRPTRSKPVEEHPTLFDAIKTCYLNGMRALSPAAAAPLLRTLNNAQTVKALADMRGPFIDALRAAQGKSAAAKLEDELNLLLFACEA